MKVLELLPIVLVLIMLYVKFAGSNLSVTLEYTTMVCKIVDPGFEKYVVETKENKSHFGTNYEYVLRVPKSVSNIEVM